MPRAKGLATGFAAMALTASISGCVGVMVNMPEQTLAETSERRSLLGKGIDPVTTMTERTSQQREWCGITVMVVVLPVPLKLPVCESYTETSYGTDPQGTPIPLVKTSQRLQSQFYGCGPFMGMGAIMHSYRGNLLCGTFDG